MTAAPVFAAILANVFVSSETSLALFSSSPAASDATVSRMIRPHGRPVAALRSAAALATVATARGSPCRSTGASSTPMLSQAWGCALA